MSFCTRVRSFQFYLEQEELRDRLELTYDLLEAGNYANLAPSGLQSGDVSFMRGLLDSAVSKIQAFVGVREEEVENIIEIVINVFEALPLALQDLMNAKSNSQVIGSLMRAFKMFTRCNIITSAIDLGQWVADNLSDITKEVLDESSSLQSGFEFGWAVSGARSLLSNARSIKTSAFVKRLSSLLKYFLSFGLFKTLGLSFESLNYNSFEERNVRKQYSSVDDFIFSILDTTVWFLERGMQAVKLGSVTPFFHSSASYSKWVDKANRVTEDAMKMNCPEVAQIDEHEFLQRMQSAIDEGEQIVKYVEDEHDRILAKRLVRELRLVSAKYLSKDAAQEDRRPPFSVLIYGDSQVAKTQFTSLLFQQYAKVHGKDANPRNMWTRNCLDKFYSGYKTSKWCIRLDDAAMFKPNGGEVDPSIADVILLSNGVSFVAPMADLEDKGVVPVRPDLLLATTNTEDLNAHAYFQCPLAVRRRFPWIVELSVKEEYRAHHVIAGVSCATTMIDPSKIEIDEGELQNTWNIKWKKLVASPGNSGSVASVETIAEFDDIYDFLAVFSAASKEHLLSQNKCRTAIEHMAEIAICKQCFYPESRCRCDNEESSIQSGDIHSEAFEYYQLHGHFEQKYIDLCTQVRELFSNSPTSVFDVPLFREEEVVVEPLDQFELTDDEMLDRRSMLTKTLDWVDDRVELAHVVARSMASGVSQLVFSTTDMVMEKASDLVVLYQVKKFKRLMSAAGERMYNTFVNWKVVGLCALLLGAWTIWKASSMFAKTFFGDLQGNVVSEFAKDDKENPWVRDEILLTDFYLPSLTKGWNNPKLSRDDVLQFVKKNVVAIKSYWEDADMKHTIPATSFCIGGHIYVTNNHCMPEVSEFMVDMTQEPTTGNVGKNVSFKLSQSMIYRIPEHDLAFFWCVLPPKADLTGLFFKREFTSLVCSGSYVNARFSQFPSTNDVDAIHCNEDTHPQLKHTMKVWFGQPSVPTEFGDCGSPLIGFTPCGPIILGIHQQWTKSVGVSGANAIVKSDIDAALSHFGMQIQCGEPNLRGMKLGSLHNKSVLRWPEEGQANLYGSEVGKVWRAAPKSRVVRTCIADAAVDEGFVERCVPPLMKGPEVWHKNVEPVLTQKFLFDKGVLDKCVESFSEDILSQLQSDQLAEIIKLDDKTTMNGYPGVKFLDKIKRQTSMGFPYRKSKENYILPIPSDEVYSDAVEYTEEVWEEIRLIRDVYARGERYMPVFVMSLKDEPVPEAKVAIKKTRGFMGGPAAWQFVYRQQLLSFVRVFQMNPFIFEGAPGLNCNSCKWKELYEYLTFFGLDTCVAGDYSKFDKRMSPMFILAAFEVIVNVLKAAGRSEEDIRAVWCIANDVAYPLTLVQSDLVEFFGSNPSGHALTVIINCLVNSLYMRYVFHELAPDHDVTKFRDYVNLITYGDDNALNVNPEIDWFNHTSIQNELAKYDVVYTMADKETESKPFLNIRDISFLKRKFVELESGRVACPLEWASLDKMLTSCVASKTVCPEEQAAQTIRSAVGEVFQYGPEKYAEYIPKFRRIVEAAGIRAYVLEETFPTYEELENRHFSACCNPEHRSGCYERAN